MIIQSCNIEIGTEEELMQFRFGGIPEGSAMIGDGCITFFQKQKAKTGFFSSIGATMEGRGREILNLTPDMVAAFESVPDRRGRLSHYNIVLTDGRRIFFALTGFDTKEAERAVGRFADLCPEKL
ncbi:MAG: hypothetical protein IKG70_06050 [Lachnospiraceae bacterium]|nr:hypothetical protein [Lachnospiraceae bacterium]